MKRETSTVQYELEEEDEVRRRIGGSVDLRPGERLQVRLGMYCGSLHCRAECVLEHLLAFACSLHRLD